MKNSDFSEKLLNLLIGIPALHERDNRNWLLRGLPPRPAGAINRPNALMTDINNIISAAEQLGKITDSGEWALVVVAKNALHFVEGTSLEKEINALISQFKSQPSAEQSPVLSNVKQKRLKEKLKRLEGQEKSLIEKIEYLQKTYTIKTEDAHKFQVKKELEKELEEIEGKIDDICQELEELDKE